jgi:phosphatidylinositol alpha-1,6-mannosyltransferase
LDKRDTALLVTRNFPPLTGGMERLTFHTYLALRQQFSVALCGPQGARAHTEPPDAVAESPLTPLPRFLLSLQWQAGRMAWRTRPRYVHAGSGLAAPAALAAGRLSGAQVSCFLHGLDLVVEHRTYRQIFLPAIRHCDRLFANSRHTAALALEAGVAPEKIHLLHPGVTMPDCSQGTRRRQAFRREYGLGEARILLSVGRLTQRKGLAPFIRHALPAIVRAEPSTLLVIIGEEPTGALKHSDGVLAEIQRAAAETGLQAHLRHLGKVDDATLEAAYFAADAHVFPVIEQAGDVEGFGMVALEAAAHGLSTVAFAVGGVPDAIAEGTTGRLVTAGSYSALSAAVVKALNNPNPQKHAHYCHAHAGRFSWQHFEERFLKLLQNMPTTQ